MSFQKLKSFLQQTEINNIKFHYYLRGLMFTTVPTRINIQDDCVDVYFHDGILTIDNKFKVNENEMPKSIITECVNCFQIINDVDEEIGYLYVRKG